MQRNLNFPQWVLEFPIKDLDLSTRGYNALKKKDILTVDQLLLMSDTELLKILWLGKKTLVNIHEAIEKLLESASALPEQDIAEEFFGTMTDSPSATQSDRESLQWRENGWILPETVTADLEAPIDILALKARPLHVLARLEIRTVRNLLNHSRSALTKAKNIGRKSVAEIEARLFDYLSGKRCDLAQACAQEKEITGHVLGTKAFVGIMLSSLTQRQQDIVTDRYGLWDGISETLQDIGDKQGLTRERIRQIEEKSLRQLRALTRQSQSEEFLHRKILNSALLHDGNLGIVFEDEVISGLADDCTFEEVALALTLIQDIDRLELDLIARHLVQVEEEVYCTDQSRAAAYIEILRSIKRALRERNRPTAERDLIQIATDQTQAASTEEPARLVQRVVTVSPSIARLRNGRVVLAEWTSFRRRDVASLAESALIVMGRSAHFKEIAQKIESTYPELGTMDQRGLHNRLTARRDKFVWVKTGTYGLKAWGLEQPPYLKNKLIELLTEAQYPLPYWHLKQKALEVCNCKETSVRMTLDLNPKIFRKFGEDQYGLRKYFE